MNIKAIKNTGIHVIAWLIYAVITFNWLSSARLDYEASLWITARFILLHAFVFYINVYLLLPKLMEKNRYILYLVSVVVLLFMVYLLQDTLDKLLIGFRPQPPEIQGMAGIPRPNGIPRPPNNRINPRVMMDLISAVAILFIGTTFWMTKQARKRQQAESALRNENLNTELKLLKSQINPHFLFNALNNIYSLSFTKARKAPELIMKLSDMLRYVLYESNETKVSLDKEVAYINNYIDFQKLKIEGETNISIDISTGYHQLYVEPMLFIPFIENAFKHSNVGREEGWISVKLSSTEQSIDFEIKNSKPARPYTKDTTAGIGLENVIKRLKLLYPDRYELIIDDTKEVYIAQLVLLV